MGKKKRCSARPGSYAIFGNSGKLMIRKNHTSTFKNSCAHPQHTRHVCPPPQWLRLTLGSGSTAECKSKQHPGSNPLETCLEIRELFSCGFRPNPSFASNNVNSSTLKRLQDSKHNDSHLHHLLFNGLADLPEI